MNFTISGVTVGEIWDAAAAGKPVTFRFVVGGEVVEVVPLAWIEKNIGTVSFNVYSNASNNTFSFYGQYPNGVPTFDDGGGSGVEPTVA